MNVVSELYTPVTRKEHSSPEETGVIISGYEREDYRYVERDTRRSVSPAPYLAGLRYSQKNFWNVIDQTLSKE